MNEASNINDLIEMFFQLKQGEQFAIAAALVTALIQIIFPQIFKAIWNILTFPFKKANTAPQATVINNYYGANAEEVQKLQKELSLKDEVVEQLLKNSQEQNIKLDERTKAFKKQAKAYKKLLKSVAEDGRSNKLDKQAEKALEHANWDKAEELLKRANQKDKKHIAKRNYELAQINALKLNYEKAIEYYQLTTELSPTNLEAWESLANLSTRIGNSQQALHAWQQLQQYANNQHQDRWHKIALLGEADILARHGDGAKALDKYTQAHQYFLSQIKRDPNNSDWQRDLSVSFNKIGNMHKANGDDNKATRAFQDSLIIRQTRAKHAPNNSDWQRDLPISFERIGDMHKANGDSDKAIKAFQDSLNIAKILTKRDPNNSDWQRGLSLSFERVGDMHRTNGDGDKAIKALQDSLNIAKTLTKRDPNNFDWQRDLSVSFERIGDMHRANGDSDKAIKAFQDSH